MWIHYDNDAAAVGHLEANGWALCKTGRWVSRDGTCRATIHPVTGSAVVAICYVEIE